MIVAYCEATLFRQWQMSGQIFDCGDYFLHKFLKKDFSIWSQLGKVVIFQAHEASKRGNRSP